MTDTPTPDTPSGPCAVRDTDGTTTCCDAHTSVYTDTGEEYCRACWRTVEARADARGEVYWSAS